MKTKFFNKSILAIFSAFLLGTGSAWAQNSPGTMQKMTFEELIIFVLLIFSIFIALMVLAVVTFAVLSLRQVMMKDLETRGVKVETLWGSMMKSLTRVVPVEKEADILLDHNYDGIRELDNHLPPWWVYMFYATIAFAAFYMVVYHVVEIESFPLSGKEYEVQMASAAAQIAEYKKTMGNSIDEKTVKFVGKDKAAIANGKDIFEKNCVTCHGKNMEGGTGPNLTDEYWLHGGSINEIFKTIKQGVASKGMISWEKKLRPIEIQDVSSYILTMQGTKPANAKEPQGEKYVPKK
jgi:cytochrome c oxidase cbb3-type subunit III